MNLSLQADCRGQIRLSLMFVAGVGASLLYAPCLAQNVSSTANLSFGTFASTSAGAIVVAIDGSRSQTGGAYPLNHGSSASAAQFSVRGKANGVYAITMPLDNAVVLSDGAGHTMSVRSFVSSLSGTNILSKNGNGQFEIGATLSVGSAQARGSYTGTFNVTVNYQ